MDRKKLLAGLALGLASITAVAGAATTLTTAVAAEPEAANETKPEAKQDAKALEIMDAFVEKIGGKKLIESIESTKVTATMSVPMAGMNAKMTIMNKAPGKMMMVMEMPGFGKQETGYDGTHGWSSDPLQGPRLMSDEEADAIKDQADPAAQVKFREQYPTIAYKGETTFEGKNAHHIHLIDKDGDESNQYYSIDSGMLLGTTGVQPSQMGDLEITTVLSEYKEFGGMQMATKMVQKFGPQEVIITIDSVEVNSVDDSVFTPPAAIKALIEAQKEG